MKRCLFFMLVILPVTVIARPAPPRDTEQLGGVAHPNETVLRAMDNADYILHARDGKLVHIPAEKVLLPHDASVNPQGMSVARDPKSGDIYVRLATIMCKSTDGGRTWSSHKMGKRACGNGPPSGYITILSDGKLIMVDMPDGGYSAKNANVLTSVDEGRSWQRIGGIERPTTFYGVSYNRWYQTYQLFRIPGEGDTLILPLSLTNDPHDPNAMVYVQYRSEDGGKIWTGPTLFTTDTLNNSRHMGGFSEGSMVKLPSGKLLAAVRFGRDRFPHSAEKGYKNVTLLNSTDNGLTWSNLRLLTTTFGQTCGFSAVLSDGTAVVIHDTRYGPGKPGARAMISYNEGKTWEDEVYYLNITVFTGSYTQSVVLEDDTIVSISGSCDKANTWKAAAGNTDIHAIRWKPLKKQPDAEKPVKKQPEAKKSVKKQPDAEKSVKKQPEAKKAAKSVR